MTTTLTFHSDPGHAWLQVPLRTIDALGIAADISDYSYRDRTNAYLEEDCDAWVFIRAFEKQHGCKPQFADKYSEESFVRSLPSFGRST
jgi:hypothetical protein